MMISNNSDFSNASWQTYATSTSWTLTTGDGLKTVYAKFRDTTGNISAAVSDTITVGNVVVAVTPATSTAPVITPLVTPITTPPATVPSLVPSVAPIKKFVQRLILGAKNDEVKRLQEFLAKDRTIYPEGMITGKFGPLTKKAIQKFQEKYGIAKKGDVGYGEVGPNTRAQINKLLAGAVAATPQLPPIAAPSAQLVQQIKAQIQILQEQVAQLLAQLMLLLQGQIQQKTGQ